VQAKQAVEDWWKFSERLIAEYSDGYVNTPDHMARQVGYPKEWLERTTWPKGPISYEKR